MMRHVETIIVGGGIAGLGCARTLTDAGYDDFLVLTKDLGGRVTHAFDSQVNYGAFYVRDDYDHILPFVSKKRRLHVDHVEFLRGHRRRKVLDVQNLPYLFSLARLTWEIWRFYRHYRRMQRGAIQISQRRAIAADPYLERRFSQSGSALMGELGADFWGEYFVRPVVRSTAFVDVDDASAAAVLVMLFPFLIPSYEFIFHVDQSYQPFASKTCLTTVTNVERVDTGWEVRSSDGTHYRSRWLILAVPPEEARHLGLLAEPLNRPVNVYMYHLTGEVRAQYREEPYNLLSPLQSDIVLTREPDGTWLFAARRHRTDFSDYFTHWRVIAEKHWEPAFHAGKHLIEADRGNNLIIAGDHNMPTMEDAYITGIYAANRVLGKAK